MVYFEGVLEKMAKKQKSFADKASGNQNNDSVFVKYVKSTKSEETGGWRFNEQIVRMQKGEQLDTALKRHAERRNGRVIILGCGDQAELSEISSDYDRQYGRG